MLFCIRFDALAYSFLMTVAPIDLPETDPVFNALKGIQIQREPTVFIRISDQDLVSLQYTMIGDSCCLGFGPENGYVWTSSNLAPTIDRDSVTSNFFDTLVTAIRRSFPSGDQDLAEFRATFSATIRQVIRQMERKGPTLADSHLYFEPSSRVQQEMLEHLRNWNCTHYKFKRFLREVARVLDIPGCPGWLLFRHGYEYILTLLPDGTFTWHWVLEPASPSRVPQEAQAGHTS
ncbi:unnamed protein product [Zymoseptoria tritici ST99CH_1E4]|uniref:Uncharacterized protein n=1 Tax=Zymoseptoria tritici ST99CH_1E4 TaxID=1276532 RepID=A0A2H1H9F0_ZYMTR|nr:unnamed protein product [Zymoseptoria tritici ST99CH_1E4]